MFCLQCGAEAPARAVTCSVCGHDLGRSSADLRSSPAPADTAPDAGLTTDTPPKVLSATRPVALASVSIHAGDLDQPGLPQDATGRALLIVILALAADLFLPWSVVDGQHQTLPVGGGVAIALLIGLAALPLLHPRLRRYTATAAVPLVVGGVCLGVGMAFWANLGSITGVSSPNCPGSCPGGFLSSAGPDFGLLVFFVGAMLVVVVGYRLFLDSARASARGEAATTAPIPTKSAQPEGQRPERDRQPAAVAAISADETTAATNPKAVSTPEVVLPGSDSWSRTLDPPPILRPRAGSIRRSHR